MLTVDEALQHVRRHAQRLPGETCRVGEALGRVLDEDVASDIDSPPYDKSTVDGYALRAADLPDGCGRLTVVEQITAGEVPRRALAAGETARIMTGAPLPAGADSVVMIERATGDAPPGDTFPHQVALADPRFAVGQNILRRAQSLAAGQVVLAAGTALRAIELGLLSEVGRTEVRVVARPRVGVLPTGNELVPAGIRPGPGQIRNSNGPMLLAAVAEAGGVLVDLGVARDEPDDLRRRIAAGLECDVLVISGGVSAGVLDLVWRAAGR
jgi:molybdopterin molybdotransferase